VAVVETGSDMARSFRDYVWSGQLAAHALQQPYMRRLERPTCSLISAGV
jgi:hypothetical protein